jgi:hypothetical protein
MTVGSIPIFKQPMNDRILATRLHPHQNAGLFSSDGPGKTIGNTVR